MGKFLKGKGASLAKTIKRVPNGGEGKSSVSLGDAASAAVESAVNAAKKKVSNFGSFSKKL